MKKSKYNVPSINGVARLSLWTTLSWAVLYGFSPETAYAYVDPGTGSAVFGGLIYLIGIGGAALAFVFRPIRRGFARLFRPIFKSRKE